jgi:hypothetical protein
MVLIIPRLMASYILYPEQEVPVFTIRNYVIIRIYGKKNPVKIGNPTARLVSDRHSFTIIETEGKNLILKQYDENGNVFDEVKVTK